MNLFQKQARDMVLEGDYKNAAIALVVSQVREKSPQDVWKWWSKGLGRRKAFPEMTRRLVEAILHEFHTGGELFRETVARMFGKQRAAAKLPVDDFIKAVRRHKKSTVPTMPERFVVIPLPPTIKRAPPKYHFPNLPISRGGALFIDLRKDAAELKKALASRIEFHTTEAAKVSGMPPVCAIVVGFYLCQRGWAVIKFDTRPQFARDGDWTTASNREVVNIPHWKKGHDLAQKSGGTFILPDGKKLKVGTGVSCKKLVAIYGGMIKTVLIDAKRSGMFKKLPTGEGCQLDVEEFDGNWGWPKFNQLGKVNLV